MRRRVIACTQSSKTTFISQIPSQYHPSAELKNTRVNMLSKSVFFLLVVVSTLFAHSSARDVEVEFAHDPTLDGGSEPESADNKVFGRDIEVQFAQDPSLDENESFNTEDQKLSNRDVEVTFATDPSLDGTGQSDSAPRRRNLKHSNIDASAHVPRDNAALLQLLQLDQQCSAQHKQQQYDKRSPELKKRVNLNPRKPAEILWTAPAQCKIVDIQLADYLDFSTGPQNVIGTYGLCGCVALAIVGNAGTIIVHLSPLVDMTAQYARVLQKFNANMRYQQTGMTAYVFRPNASPPDIKPESAAAAASLVKDMAEWIVAQLEIPVVAQGYDPGDNTPDNRRLGTLVSAVVSGVITVWINNRRAHP